MNSDEEEKISEHSFKRRRRTSAGGSSSSSSSSVGSDHGYTAQTEKKLYEFNDEESRTISEEYGNESVALQIFSNISIYIKSEDIPDNVKVGPIEFNSNSTFCFKVNAIITSVFGPVICKLIETHVISNIPAESEYENTSIVKMKFMSRCALADMTDRKYDPLFGDKARKVLMATKLNSLEIPVIVAMWFHKPTEKISYANIEDRTDRKKFYNLKNNKELCDALKAIVSVRNTLAHSVTTEIDQPSRQEIHTFIHSIANALGVNKSIIDAYFDATFSTSTGNFDIVLDTSASSSSSFNTDAPTANRVLHLAGASLTGTTDFDTENDLNTSASSSSSSGTTTIGLPVDDADRSLLNENIDYRTFIEFIISKQGNVEKAINNARLRNTEIVLYGARQTPIYTYSPNEISIIVSNERCGIKKNGDSVTLLRLVRGVSFKYYDIKYIACLHQILMNFLWIHGNIRSGIVTGGRITQTAAAYNAVRKTIRHIENEKTQLSKELHYFFECLLRFIEERLAFVTIFENVHQDGSMINYEDLTSSENTSRIIKKHFGTGDFNRETVRVFLLPVEKLIYRILLPYTAALIASIHPRELEMTLDKGSTLYAHLVELFRPIRAVMSTCLKCGIVREESHSDIFRVDELHY